MPREAIEPTSTVSVCVSPEEHRNVRDAASAANLAVSAWGASRLMLALATPKGRKGAREAAERMAASPLPRGARSGRVSVVLRVAEHDVAKGVAEKLAVTPHALCQAILVDAAAREVADMPEPVRRAVEVTKREAKAAGTALVHLPPDLAKVDPHALSDMLAQLVSATAVKVLDGQGRALAAQVVKMAAQLKLKPLVVVKVRIPDLHFIAPAFVLDVPAADYATVLAVKAARVLKAAE